MKQPKNYARKADGLALDNPRSQAVTSTAKSYIGEFEELVLLAVLTLGEKAYGVTILEALEGADRRVSIGALYTTLSRLEEKGLVKSWMGEPTAERGGRAKKHFKVEATGALALKEAEQARSKLKVSFGRAIDTSGGLT
jgi:DNA-binding PadR family transcriptional regulator